MLVSAVMVSAVMVAAVMVAAVMVAAVMVAVVMVAVGMVAVGMVAVGMALSGPPPPPHGSVREELLHTALAAGSVAQTLVRVRMHDAGLRNPAVR